MLSATALLAAGSLAIPASAVGTATAAFTFAPTQPSVNQVVLFDGSTSEPGVPGTPLTYAWDFDNNGSTDSTVVNPERAWTARGIYPVKLTVDDGLTSDDVTMDVYVGEHAPTASISGPASGNVDATLSFSSNAADADNDALTYSWTYTVNNGAPVSLGNTASIQRAFHDAGSYTLKVVVDDGITTTTATKVVTINNTAPNASSEITPSGAHASQQVTFDASGTTDAETAANGLTYHWDFGDGTSSALKVAQHTYATGGTKAVVLTVTDPQGLTDTVETSLAIGANGNPTAMITVDHDYVHANTDVHFSSAGSTDAETPADVTFAWDFDNNGTADAAGPTATHAYPTNNVYTAKLTVSDGHGGTTSTTKQIHVGNYGPTAAYTIDHNPAKINELVTFDGTTSSDPEGSSLAYAWSYTFDGGAPVSLGTTATVQQAFAVAGSYSVTLKVTDSDDNFTDVETKTLTVTNTAPTASGTATPSSPYQYAEVAFDASASTDAESATGLTYAWDFDNNGTTDATGVTATHVFTEASGLLQSETVALTVTDPQGLSGTDDISVTVGANDKPVAAIAPPTPEPAHAGTPVSFDGSGSTDSSAVSSYAWDFGDGGTSTQQKPTHAFTTVGEHVVTLVVTDDNGAKSDPATVTVHTTNAAPTVTVNASPNPAHIGQVVHFNANGNDTDGDTLTYAWTFGDGATANVKAPSHAYAELGTYTAKVTVTDPYGGTVSKSFGVDVVNTAPTVTASVTPGSVWKGTAQSFSALGDDLETPDTLTYLWAFGDGTTSTSPAVSHTYAQPGTYRAQVTVTDEQGLTATAVRTVLVGLQVSCASTKVVKTGSWRQVLNANATGGRYCDNLGTATGTDTLRVKMTGQRMGFTFARAVKGGSAKVYIDGVYRKTISFKSTSAKPVFGYRQVFTGLSNTTHTMKIVVTGGAAYVDDIWVWGPLV